MPYKKTAEHLKELVNKSLERDPDLRRGLDDADLSQEAITSALVDQADAIWAGVSAQIADAENIETRFAKKSRDVVERLHLDDPLASQYRLGPWYHAWISRLLGRRSFPAGFWIAVLVSAVSIGVVVVNVATGRGGNVDIWLRGILGDVLFRLAINLLLVVVLIGVLALLPQALYAWRIIRAKGFRSEMRRLVGEMDAAFAEVDEQLIGRGIPEQIRHEINYLRPTEFSESVPAIGFSGLAEVYQSAYEIPTVGKENLRHLLNGLPGGSIGIAGPRGIGKSTLLISFCTNPVLDGKKVLPILLSAPVKYDPRDFLLHVFASVCQAVLKAASADELPLERAPLQALAYASFITVRILSFMAFLGLTLIALSVGLALALTGSESQRALSLRDFLTAMAVKPWDLMLSGVLILVLGLVGLFIRGARGRIQSSQESSITLRAQEQLRTIRFLRTYSSGWTGALKPPVGIEIGSSGGTSSAERQQSLPEITSALRDFIKDVTRQKEYDRVIIGIDELDKMDSPEAATQFLNEIKSIFGIPNCFFLIAVSESAISCFERRGLPFRDVFDSSFDTISYVDYLDLASSKRLLNRRVIRVPPPFLCLCHCLSGGLPRDLIRICRDLARLVAAEPAGAMQLSDLCRAYLVRDAFHKIRAVGIAARDIALEPDRTQFLDLLRRNENSVSGSDKMLAAAELFAVGDGSDESDSNQHQRNRLRALSNELAVYLYYIATALDFFTSIDEPAWKVAEHSERGSPGAFDQLARTRQLLAVNPQIALAAIKEFRSVHLPKAKLT